MFLSDFDSLFEKFSIITTDGKMTDLGAFEFLKDKTTPSLYNELLRKIRELTSG